VGARLVEAFNMLKRFTFMAAVVALTLFAVFGCTKALGVKPAPEPPRQELPRCPSELKFQEFKFRMPAPERIVMPNGMVVYLLPDGEQPYVRFHGVLRAGSVFDPADKAGLAKLTADLVRNGGTMGAAPETVNETLDGLGASVDLTVDRDACRFSGAFRNVDSEKMIELLSGMLARPDFMQECVGLRKGPFIEAARRAAKDERAVAEAVFCRALFGANPCGNQPEGTEKTLSSISRDDVAAFHGLFYSPQNAVIGFSGGFDPAEMKRVVLKVFGKWARSEGNVPRLPEIPAERATNVSVFLIQKDSPEAEFMLGRRFIPKVGDEMFGLMLAAQVLSGVGTTSRLRERFAGAEISHDPGCGLEFQPWAGVFRVTGRAAAARAADAIGMVMEEMRSLTVSVAEEGELRRAKDALLNSFLFRFDTPYDSVVGHVEAEFATSSSDCLRSFRDDVERQRRESVLEAAMGALEPKGLVVVVTGDIKVIGPQMERFGTVVVVAPELPGQPEGKGAGENAGSR
jgi:zinc protease